MEQNSLRNPYKTLVIIVASVFFSLLILITVLGLWGLKPLLTKRIQTAVMESTNGLYAIDFKSLQYDVLSGNAQVSEVIWRADSTVFDGLKKKINFLIIFMKQKWIKLN